MPILETVNISQSKYFKYVFFPTAFLYAITLSLPVAYNSVFILLMLIVTLGNRKMISKNLSSYFSNKRSIILLALFLCLLASVVYSDDKKTAFKSLLAAVPFIVLPFSLTGLALLSKRQIEIIKKGFVYSCFVISLFYLIQTTFRIGLWDGSYKHQTGLVGYKSSYLVYNLTYHQLTPSIHAVFFSLYIAIAVLLLIFYFKWENGTSAVLQGGLILYFLCYLILLTSVTINFGLYSFIIAYLFFNLSFKKPIHYVIFFGIVIIATAIIDYLLVVKYIGPDIGDIIYRFDSPSINQKLIWSFILVIAFSVLGIFIKRILLPHRRFGLPLALLVAAIVTISFFWEKTTLLFNPGSGVNNLSVRANYGAESFKIIRSAPLFGVGIGDKKFELLQRDTSLGNKRYVEFGASTKPGDIFNPHNQFLDFWIAAGIVPVVCLVLLFIGEFNKAFKYRSMPYLGLVFIFFLFCFTDKALMVQRGQSFFLFFICLFEPEGKRKKEDARINLIK